MASVGDEKRIQALFSELSLGDKAHGPRFETLWSRAEANARVPALLDLRTATAMIMVVAAVTSLVAAVWHRSSQSQYAASIPPQHISTLQVPAIKSPEKLLPADSKTFHSGRRRRSVRQRHTQRPAGNTVAMLSTWQSPTRIFLQSPTTSHLSSLPQLNQSARDLETFLPKNHEVIKESNQ